MKKFVFLIISGLMMINVHAKESYCGYKDYFRISDKANPGIYIFSGYSDSDSIIEIVGPHSFIIKDSGQCRNGYAYVTVGYDLANWCVLNIKDGPYINHPQVTATCNGIRYVNIQYDGFQSYSYTINLD